jgi:hypothetical protein
MYNNFKKILSNTEDTFKTEFGEIENLRELRTMLFSKGKKFFKNYVNEENHFANWIENSFEDRELAGNLRKTKSFGQTLKILDDRIKFAELWLRHNEDKEKITQYMSSQNFSLQPNFSPANKKFQTLSNFKMANIEKPVSIQEQLETEVDKLKNLKHKYEFSLDEPNITNQLKPLFEEKKKLNFFQRFTIRK